MSEDALVAEPDTGGSDPIAVRLVQWNIAMGVPKKADALASLHPTIAVLPECAELSKVLPVMERIGATGGQWVGSLPNKGLSSPPWGGVPAPTCRSCPVPSARPEVSRAVAPTGSHHKTPPPPGGQGEDTGVTPRNRRAGVCPTS